MSKHKIFVYGTLRPGKGEKVMIPGQIYDFGWFPGLILNEGGPDSFVTAEVIEADDEKLAQLDRYEGYYEEDPQRSLYVRQKLWDGWVYVYNKSVDKSSLVVSGDWLEYTKKEEGASARLTEVNNGKPLEEEAR